jgi:hypothetical protein
MPNFVTTVSCKKLLDKHRHVLMFSVLPSPVMQSVLVHQLSRFATQNPFRKNRGRVMRVAFHPAKPFFFVATQNTVRIYNLAKQVSQRL